MKPLTCIKCDKQSEPSHPNLESNEPYAATIFVAYGNYGSTVFDPIMPNNPLHLEINVCDDCLREAIAKDQVLAVSKDVTTVWTQLIYSEAEKAGWV